MVLGVLAPPCWAASAVERYFRRFPNASLPPPTRLLTIMTRVVWFFIFFVVLFAPCYLLVAIVYTVLTGDFD